MERMVGATGFEPVTSRTPSVRATRLRYAPTRETAFYHPPENRTRSRAYLSARKNPCPQAVFMIFNRFFRH